MAQKVSDIIAGMKGVMGNDMPEKGDYDDADTVDFPMPDGYQLPSGVKPGDEFTALGTFRLNEDGDLCITKLAGIPVHAGEQPEQAGTPNPGPAPASMVGP